MLASESQEPAEQLGAAIGRRMDVLHRLAERVRGLGAIERVLRQCGTTTDDGQQVVEVVGDARAQIL